MDGVPAAPETVREPAAINTMANLDNKIASNVGWLLSARVLTFLLNASNSIILGRFLGKAAFGKINLILSFYAVIQCVAVFGLDIVLVRKIVRDKDRQNLYFSNALLMQLCFSVLGWIIAMLLIPGLGYDLELQHLFVLASFHLFFLWGSMLIALFQSHLRTQLYSLPDFLAALLIICLNLVFLYFQAPLRYFLLVQVSLVVFQAVQYALLVRKIEGFRWQLSFDWGICRDFFHLAWPLFVLNVANMINLKADNFLLFHYLDEMHLGIYVAAYKLTESLSVVAAVFGAILYPVFCSKYESDPEAFRNLYRKSLRFMSALIFPVIALFMALGPEILTLLFGSAYRDGGPVIQIIIWCQFFVFTGVISNAVLNASGLQKLNMLFSVVGVLTIFAANVILIPRYGLTGAAMAKVLTFSCLGYLPALFFRQSREVVGAILAMSFKPFLAGSGMFLVLRLITPASALLAVCAGALAYGIILYFLRAFTREDLKLFLPAIG